MQGSPWKKPPHFSWRGKTTSSSSQEKSHLPGTLCHHSALKAPKLDCLTWPTRMALVCAGEADNLPAASGLLVDGLPCQEPLLISAFFTTFPTHEPHLIQPYAHYNTVSAGHWELTGETLLWIHRAHSKSCTWGSFALHFSSPSTPGHFFQLSPQGGFNRQPRRFGL